MKEIVTQKELSEFLGVSQQAVSKMKFPRTSESPVEYNFLDAIKYYIGQKKKEGSRLNLGEARAKLAREQQLKTKVETKLKRLELMKLQGKLVEVAGLQKELDKVVLACRAKLLAIPCRMAGELSDSKPAKIESRLRDVIEEALMELANGV